MEAAHGASYSQDLSDSVIDEALEGTKARQAAESFGIGDDTDIIWVRRARQRGERKASKQGQIRRCKIDPHRDYILGLITATPDLTIRELLARLLEERGVREERETLWKFLDCCGLTYKKRPLTPRSGTAQIS